jgi:glycosyltransferase involved in cell wall biosynthesis
MPNPETFPRVSIIIPTLNVEALLENCLGSILRQTYPRDRYEILLADAHSQDRTREIAAKYGAIVLDDNGRNMEEGKRMALNRASGDYIVFMDADNELTHSDYLQLAVAALQAHPQTLGVEAYYPASPRMSSFCAYITQLLAREGGIERWTLPNDSAAYPLGANGFVFRRADLNAVNAGEHFQDTHVAVRLMQQGKREWLRLAGRGVHHYYVQTLSGFIRKRRRSTVHFLNVQEEAPLNWMKQKPRFPLWLAALYCGTVIGPLCHSVAGVFRDGDWRWLWHAPACAGAVIGNIWGILTHRRHRKDAKLIAKLQVKQTIKR